MREFRPDVLILEHKLPWGGGDGVLARLREDPHFAMTPVILIGEETGEITADLLRSPVSSCLRKPYQFDQLLECIRVAVPRLHRPVRKNKDNGKLVAGHVGPHLDSFVRPH